eukprot:2241507-Pleurochrysis_carterae.AAC.2
MADVKRVVEEVEKRVPRNLGVTAYGYVMNLASPESPWIPSYHRFGRRWHMDDMVLSAESVQLPFGTYTDSCSPIASSSKHFNSKSPHPSEISMKLKKIVVNQIINTVLQPDYRYGSQARYAHVRTCGVGLLQPPEFLKLIYQTRLYTVSGKGYTKSSSPRIVEKVDNTYRIEYGQSVEFSIAVAAGLIVRIPPEKYGEAVETKRLKDSKAYVSSKDAFFAASTNVSPKVTSLESLLRTNQVVSIRTMLDTSKERTEKFDIKEIVRRADTNKVNGRTALVTASNMRVTAYDVNESVLRNDIAFGLRRTSAEDDARNLDRSLLLIDGEIYCRSYSDEVIHGGSDECLGIDGDGIDVNGGRSALPQILPIKNSGETVYNYQFQRAKRLSNLLIKDAEGGIGNLIDRLVTNVFSPILEGGGISKSMHFMDLMIRFNDYLGDGEPRSNMVRNFKRQHPNVMKALTYYL